MENTAIAMESLDTLARILGHCGIYEKLYGQQIPSASQPLDAFEPLSGALVELYLLVLEYLCYLKRHLGHNTAGKLCLVPVRSKMFTTLWIYWRVLLISFESRVSEISRPVSSCDGRRYWLWRLQLTKQRMLPSKKVGKISTF